MNFSLVQTESDFLTLGKEWNDLLSRSEANTIFLTWEWISSWWESYGRAQGTLHIITVRDAAGALIGLAPFYRRTQRWAPPRPVRTLHLIGDGSWDSDYLDIILVKDREEEILSGLWKYLTNDKGSWNLLRLSGVPQDSATLRWLKRTDDEGETVSRTENIPCSVTDLPGSWDTYLGLLKPRFRTKIRSTLRELDASHQIRFRSVETDQERKAGLQKLFELHGKRWAVKGTGGVFGNSAKRAFYERFTKQFLDRGWLAFDFLEVDDKVVACQMCFRYVDTQFLLQEGFDPEFASESVGIALRALVFKKAIEQGVRQYDFLAGVGRHKTQWLARVKHSETIAVGRRTLQNTLYLRAPVILDAARSRVKAMLPDKVLEVRRRLLAS
jgi:CelD/BcsL family acetyltransferase involved in cellulose biosynthesis